jgi:CspA family cold shock protein
MATVKWFNNARGFGFLETERGEAFLYQEDIVMAGFRCLDKGQEVTCSLTKTPKGLRAYAVRPKKKGGE